MKQLTVSYGLISPQHSSQRESHILPITKIYTCPDLQIYLTCGRDGSIVINHMDPHSQAAKKRLLVHSDWVCDLIRVGSTRKFISVSHDFSIVLFEIMEDCETWDMKIIGDHDDYIKCIVPLPSMSGGDEEREDAEVPFWFATGGLDKKIKIWKLIGAEGSNSQTEVELVHVFDNSHEEDETGSIYTMAPVTSEGQLPFDLVVGDCNGDVIFYSVHDKVELKRLKNVHSSNTKVVKLIDDCTKLITTCSNGLIYLWDLSKFELMTDFNVKPAKVGSWKWDCSIWCIYGDSLNHIIIGDSKGRISRLDFNLISHDNNNNEGLNLNHKELKFTSIFNPKSYKQLFNDKTITKHDNDNNKHNNNESKPKNMGILNINILDHNSLVFSFCTDSNLNCLNLKTKELVINKGGFALTRSSLLTNRRHVITENTKGEVQRWDIVSCELLNTFKPDDGSFDDLVMKFTSKEILSHWCTVTVKVGVLFVKINQKFLNTEVYGTALENYDIINDVEINPDQRYNLGKTVVNSLFNEFLTYEIKKDELIRKEIVNRKKKEKENVSKEAINNKLISSDSEKPFSRKNTNKKNKFTRNIAMKSSSNLNGTNSNYSPDVYVSAPGTPITTDDTHKPFNLRTNVNYDLKPPGSAPPLMVNTPNEESSNIIQPSPLSSENNTVISPGKASLLSRRFKSLRNSNPSKSGSGINTPEEPLSDMDGLLGEDSNESSRDMSSEPVLWNQSSGIDNINSTKNTPLNSSNSAYGKVKSVDSSRLNSTTTVNSNSNIPLINNSAPKEKEFMSDLLAEIKDVYIQEYNNNSSSLKLLTKRLPESKIDRDLRCPLIQVKSGSLLLVHLWRDGACGGTVLFSTFLPPSRIEDNDSDDENNDNDTSRLESEDLDYDQLKQYDFTESEYGITMNRRQVFGQLEKNLPYWFAKMLFKNVKIENDSQPKLNFIIVPWVDSEHEKGKQNGSDGPQQQQQQQFHHMLKFGRTKSNDPVSASTDLPKVSDSNAKLVAPGMIRVKKIKYYVIDRFDSKTPEMKAKVDPSVWLELLCKGQVLENDMTLSTVRTLYWKSQSEIVIEYRRKLTASPLANEIH